MISTHFLITFVFLLRFCFVLAKAECTSTIECEQIFQKGSICDEDGYCTNPFAIGCLRTLREDEKYKKTNRVCNSQDNTTEFCTGYGLQRYLNYPEISIFANDYERAIVIGWVVQILLSEVLGVPASIQTGKDGVLNFYDINNSFQFALNNHFEAMIEANRVNGDCSKSNSTCAHFMPEVWVDPPDVGAIETSKNGVVVTESWWITQRTVDRHPGLSHYFGLRGEENRKKLADVFLRPTSWKYYCMHVSKTRCEVEDGIAKRPPVPSDDKEEENLYYDDKNYKGHFRMTDKNNCTKNPDCTGHFVVYPCNWRSHAEKVIYWNKMALEAPEYTYGEILQITKAASATGSDLLIEWWAPSPLVQNLFRVTLPKPTSECIFQRSEAKSSRCDQNVTERRGNHGSGCNYAPKVMDNIFATTFADSFFNGPKAMRSPAYPFLKKIQISDTSIDELLKDWNARGGDYGYAGRETVCKWVAENIDLYANLTQYLPAGYPRTISKRNNNNTLPTITIALGSIVSVAVLVTGFATCYHRKKKIIMYAQPQFMYLFLVGYLSVSISAILYGMAASNSVCMLREWTLLIGYTLGNVPLLVKTAAINKLLQSAKKMKRVQITQSRLFADIGVSVSITTVFLLCWTIINPITKEEDLVLLVENKNDIELIVGCSKAGIWSYIGSLLQASYVFCSFVLAIQSRDVVQKFNESKDVRNMAFASFMFLCFRVIVQHIISTTLDPEIFNSIIGIILSFDTIANLTVYFAPKFVKLYKHDSSDFAQQPTISGLDSKSRVSCFDYQSNVSGFDNKTNVPNFDKSYQNDTDSQSIMRSMKKSIRRSGLDDESNNQLESRNKSNVSGLHNNSNGSGLHYNSTPSHPDDVINYAVSKTLTIESIYTHCRQAIETGKTEMSLSLLVESIENDTPLEPVESDTFKTPSN